MLLLRWSGRCGERKNITVIDKLGDSWDGGIVTKQPTETETGVKTYICSVCGEVKEELLPIAEKQPTNPETGKNEPSGSEGG